MTGSEQSLRARALIPFIPYIVVSAVHCALIVFDLPGSSYETKQLLMPALALAAVWSVRGERPWPRTAMLLVLAAVAASWAGDGAGLFFPGLPTLPMMILFFAVAHICYIVLFWRAPGLPRPRRVPLWALVYAIWWIATLAVVGPHSGSLLIPLALYGLVLGGTAALSTRLGPTVAWGGVFFLVSDTLLAFREFLDAPTWAGDLVMITYTLGQGLIVYGVVSLLRRGGAGARRAPSEPDQAAG
jgi:uncharacterized membrane protein YhhN